MSQTSSLLISCLMSYMLIQIAFKKVDELKANCVWLDQENQHFGIMKFASQLSF